MSNQSSTVNVAVLAGAAGALVVLSMQALFRRFMSVPSSGFQVCATRLGPGQDVKQGILDLAKKHNLQAGMVICSVGSCQGAHIRLANADRDHPNEKLRLEGRFEILSLIGTVSANGNHHLHVSLGDAEGNVIGGHLLGDMPVFTTAEIVLGECENLQWSRAFDNTTGYSELAVCERSALC